MAPKKDSPLDEQINDVSADATEANLDAAVEDALTRIIDRADADNPVLDDGLLEETVLNSAVTDETVLATPAVDETVVFPVPAPSYDEEHGTGIGQEYRQDFSRMDRAYQDPRKAREIPIPHIADEDGAGYRVPGEGRSRSRWRPLLAFFLVGIMAALIFAAATYGLEAWGGKTVPNVQGISEARARTMLEEAGFVPEVKTRIADDGIGFVIEQDPANGSRVSEGTTVTIVVAVSRTMPDVIGLTQEEAQDLLGKAGAQTVEVETASSNEPEGTVIGVSPGVGEAFSAYQTITLTVASKVSVPDVVGKDKVEATALLEAAGLAAETSYVNEEGTTNSVLRTEPAAGEKVDPGSKVKIVVVEPMPSDPLHLLEYFGKQSPSIDRYLTSKGLSLSSSFTSSEGEAEAVYSSDSYGNLCFCNRPYSHTYIHGQNTGENVLKDNHPFVGIRWEVPSSMVGSGASDKEREAITKDLMNRCVLANVTDVCTHSDVHLPEGLSKSKAQFRCTYGEANGMAWTILVVNEDGGTRAVVTCAPVSYYTSNYDLDPYGGSICDFVACADAYGER